MVYIIFNVILSISLIFFTSQANKKIKDQTITVSSLPAAMLFNVLASVVFTFLLILKEIGYETFVSTAMRFVFISEGIAMIILSFSFIEMGCRVHHSVLDILKIIAIIFVFYIVIFKIKMIKMSPDYGFSIQSDTVFKGYIKNFIPIKWLQVYSLYIRFIMPMVGYLVLVLLQEHHKVTQLEKYQTIIMGSGVLLMWIIYLGVRFVSHAALNTGYLYMFGYSYMYIVIYMALTKTNVPSGKASSVSLFKVFVSYLIPATIVGGICAIFQPVVNSPKLPFVIMFSIVGGLIILVAVTLSYVLSSTTKLYTADYGSVLEKELAAVEYREADMDAITAKMFEILKKNAEASSLNVYIASGQYELETAYSSNNLNLKILLTNPIFDLLLNINKTIVVYSEIEKEHSLFAIQDGLKEFFEYTKSDALFILNEGHNIFGIITLGKKTTGDHFKSYDYNVFEKLYSYFFVFGYYMRNISNRDIIGIVNREIRMSSQIITSIQENVDKVKSEKVDIGYMMVPAHNIGGEFIDLIRLTDTRHLFVVGDLSGKGIAASMNMVILKSIIRTHLSEIHDFKELVVRLNRFVRDSLPKGTIFSGLFALVDFETNTMYYINCGIPALMMYTQVYNNVIEIQGSGHVLGFVKDISPYISVKTTKLNPGDILLACTDGLVNSHSLRGEQFGKERVQQALLDNAGYNAQRMAQFTFDGLVKFMSKEMEDDVSILVIKYEGLPGEKVEPQIQNQAQAQAQGDAGNDEVIEELDEVEELEEVDDSDMFNSDDFMAAPEGSEEIANHPEEAENVETIIEPEADADGNSSASQPENKNGDDGGEGSVEIPPYNGPVPTDENGEMPDLSDLDDLLKEAGL